MESGNVYNKTRTVPRTINIIVKLVETAEEVLSEMNENFIVVASGCFWCFWISPLAVTGPTK